VTSTLSGSGVDASTNKDGVDRFLGTGLGSAFAVGAGGREGGDGAGFCGFIAGLSGSAGSETEKKM
jgi:hypothetical protein